MNEKPIVDLVDALFARLRELGSSLKPVDEKNGWFFEVVFELVDATLSNYHQLRRGYDDGNNPLLAWACRNLLELAIFTKYILMSETNARRFADDRLIDGCDIFRSLRDLELHIDPQSDTKVLDDAIASFKAQMAAERVTEKKFLGTGSLADIVGMKADYTCMNRVCSKLVHPTGWSILAVNKGKNSFPGVRDILFQSGGAYGSEIYLAVRDHNAGHGMKPKR